MLSFIIPYLDFAKFIFGSFNKSYQLLLQLLIGFIQEQILEDSLIFFGIGKFIGNYLFVLILFIYVIFA